MVKSMKLMQRGEFHSLPCSSICLRIKTSSAHGPPLLRPACSFRSKGSVISAILISNYITLLKTFMMTERNIIHCTSIIVTVNQRSPLYSILNEIIMNIHIALKTRLRFNYKAWMLVSLLSSHIFCRILVKVVCVHYSVLKNSAFIYSNIYNS